jgi:hypothetical protein
MTIQINSFDLLMLITAVGRYDLQSEAPNSILNNGKSSIQYMHNSNSVVFLNGFDHGVIDDYSAAFTRFSGVRNYSNLIKFYLSVKGLCVASVSR